MIIRTTFNRKLSTIGYNGWGRESLLSAGLSVSPTLLAYERMKPGVRACVQSMGAQELTDKE